MLTALVPWHISPSYMLGEGLIWVRNFVRVIIKYNIYVNLLTTLVPWHISPSYMLGEGFICIIILFITLKVKVSESKKRYLYTAADYSLSTRVYSCC